MKDNVKTVSGLMALISGGAMSFWQEMEISLRIIALVVGIAIAIATFILDRRDKKRKQ
jgi:hypothetical protein